MICALHSAQIEWFEVIVTIVTGYLGNRRLVVPLILPRTWDPGYTCTCTLHYMYMPARRPRARSCIYRPGLACVSWSQDLAARMRSLGPRPLCMHDAQQRVAVQYIPARSCLCRRVRLEPGYKSLITPPLRDMAGIYALRPRASCVYTCYITRGGVITNTSISLS